jgi:hypothetical protein
LWPLLLTPIKLRADSFSLLPLTHLVIICASSCLPSLQKGSSWDQCSQPTRFLLGPCR